MVVDKISINKDISESDLYLALEDLVIYTLRKQLSGSINKENFTPQTWAKEFCTVEFRGPRQSGHSTSVVKLCKYIFRNPLIIVPRYDMKNVLFEKFKTETLPKIIWLEEIPKMKGNVFDGIIFDNSSLVRSFIHNIQEEFSYTAYDSPSFCFVFLG